MAKLIHCDGCGKMRRDVIACGRDYNGDPEAPDLCFICRKEGERNKIYDRKLKKYISAQEYYFYYYENNINYNA